MRSMRLDVATAFAALATIAVGAGLEGGYEHRMGMAACWVAAGAVALALIGGELPRLSRSARVAMAVLAAVVLVQALPMPNGVRHLVAPGQAALRDRLAGILAVDRDQWLTELTKFDLDVLLGQGGSWSFDVLAGAVATDWAQGAISPSRLAWQGGLWAVYGALVLVGWRLGRSQPAARVFWIGMLLLAVAEALFGIGNRNGPSTGLSTKVAYLGSATGTFINRGHFGAFLLFGIGGAWGLASSLFPLLPEEVRKHQQRKRRSSQPPGILEASGDRLPRLGLLAFASGLLFVALLASTSRGPVLSLVVAGLVVGGWTRYRRDDGVHLGIGLAVPLVGAAVAAVAAGPFGALARFKALGLEDVSLRARQDYWTASWAAFADAPIFGSGLGAWRFATSQHEVAPHLYSPNHAHNEYLEILVEMGAVGTAALLALGFVAANGIRRRLDLVEHDWRSAAAVGGCVSLVAIAIQAIGDFQMRTPGVAIPTAITLGFVLGALDVGETGGRRAPVLALLALGLAAVSWRGGIDLASPGSRAERLNEAAPAVLLPQEIDAAAADAACDAAAAEPFDAWAHAACALATSRVAEAEDSATLAFAADVASTRALSLQVRHPRLRVVLAGSWLRLGAPTGLPDALSERATVALMAAVAEDGWRAEDAFGLARTIGGTAVDRIGLSASNEPISRARTLYQYALALDQAGRTHEARLAAEESARNDPAYGPPAFRAGVLSQREGDADAAETWFRAFLAARDRPVGMEGWVLFHLDELDAATVRFRRAVAVDRKNRWAWEGLASVAKLHDDSHAEIEAWRQVLAITPGHPLATERMKVLGHGQD